MSIRADEISQIDEHNFQKAYKIVQSFLLSEQHPDGYWLGELSSSALSTATAIVAIKLGLEKGIITSDVATSKLESGLDWLMKHVNPDGAWGDTIKSHSNLSTSALVWAAIGLFPEKEPISRKVVIRAENWISKKAGGLSPKILSKAIIRRYGNDRTFSIPILTMCALCGRLGTGHKAWKYVIPLPFELAAFPHSWFAALKLPVVSYALPALIAIGLVRHIKSPSVLPWVRFIRQQLIKKVLQKLSSVQPTNGGFLEATPLTSFVTMSLIAAGFDDLGVTHKGLDFILHSQRKDGSWPIDTNLSTWVTSLSIHALECSDSHDGYFSKETKERLTSWYISQQYSEVHPYTQANPGGWAWTPLPGGVPDADDTPGALIALSLIAPKSDSYIHSINLGCKWLMDLQNSDGGIPTFCKGWGKLPFDKSSPDLTAHTIRAWIRCYDDLSDDHQKLIRNKLKRALGYLKKSREIDGSWLPLWFGNQWREDETNPIYGTCKVISALAETMMSPFKTMLPKAFQSDKLIEYLVNSQLADGSWGLESPNSGSIEETALAIEALALIKQAAKSDKMFQNCWQENFNSSLYKGVQFLTDSTIENKVKEPSPIGFYFAKLWYFEKIYPLSFTACAFKEISNLKDLGLLD